jgi:hypothetical protein
MEPKLHQRAVPGVLSENILLVRKPFAVFFCEFHFAVDTHTNGAVIDM